MIGTESAPNSAPAAAQGASPSAAPQPAAEPEAEPLAPEAPAAPVSRSASAEAAAESAQPAAAEPREAAPKDGDVHETSPNGQRYVKLDVLLGSGAYKDVWRAYDTREGIEVAWNVIKLKRIPVNDRKRVKNEVLLLKEIEHKNIIKYHSSWMDREKQCVIFITEIMSSGSLKEYLRKNPMVRWKAVKRWCLQILDGLSFLHSKHIIHRDIKCDNIFINGSTGDIRIGDLGLSTRIGLRDGLTGPSGGTSSADEDDREVTTETMTCLGTPEFMAPELYDENYDVKVDIYAFGMSCLEMITALTPYHLCTSAAQIYKKVSKGELPPELLKVHNRNARAFISACLQPHELRPTADQLLEHEFLKEKEEEDFKFVRGKLGSGGLEELKEGEEEEDVGEQPAAPPQSMGQVAVPSPASSPGRATLSLGAVPLSGEQGGASLLETTASNARDKCEEGKRSESTSEMSRVESSTTRDRQRAERSGEGGAEDPENAAASDDRVDNRDRERSRGDSGEGSGVLAGRSRILRVQTRSGSASGPDLRPSPGPGAVPLSLDDILERSPMVKSSSEPADLSSKGAVSGLVTLPVSTVNVDGDALETHSEPVDFENTLPKHLLSSATVFDLLDIDPAEPENRDGNSGSARNNEALIIMMAVPGSDGSSYKEVGFEFNLLTDDPATVVEEMQTDEDLMDIIEPHAANIVSVLTEVCDVARRVAKDRIEKNNFELPLSEAVLKEILLKQSIGDISYSHYVDCSDGTFFDPLAALCTTARVRELASVHSWGLRQNIRNEDMNFDTVSDMEADKILYQDPSYLEIVAAWEENVSRVGKEYDRAKASFSSQKEKLDENFKRDSEQCLARKSDLNVQLEDMQRKLKARMLDFDKMKGDLIARQKEKRNERRRSSNLTIESPLE